MGKAEEAAVNTDRTTAANDSDLPTYETSTESNLPPAYDETPAEDAEVSAGQIIHTLTGPLPVTATFTVEHSEAAQWQRSSLTICDFNPPSAPLYHGTFMTNKASEGTGLPVPEVTGLSIRRGPESAGVVGEVKLDSPKHVTLTMASPTATLKLEPTAEHREGDEWVDSIVAEPSRAEASIAAAQGRSARDKGKGNQKADHFHYVVHGLAGGNLALYWRSSGEFLHDAKGKGKGGDLKLTDKAGEVFAVFLNKWDGRKSSKVLGKLSVTRKTVEYGIQDEVAVSLLALISKAILKVNVPSTGTQVAGASMGVLAACVVS